MKDNKNFYEKVKERAYLKHLDKEHSHIYSSMKEDWEESEREEGIIERVKEEAYYSYLKYGDNPEANWNHAEKNIRERLQFLAFYMHESNIDRSPIENWVDAQKVYLANF